MSGIAGIFNRNSEPVNPALLKQMTGVIAHRGPDGIGSWIDGQFGASQLLLATTPESVEEHSPMFNERSSLCMVFDGRVDNRQELAGSLLSHGIRCRGDTDMELVLKAYELWGASCLEKVLGDFAFAIWDRNRQQLFCARDIFGFRPFYYSIAQGYFVFGSELCQLIEHHAVPRRANLGMMAEYLAGAIGNFDETLYLDIKRLPPAHYMLVEKEKFHVRKYWDLDPRKSIRYSRDSEYVEHYLEVLRQSVECRLRCRGKVGASMSGGLDSTSIVSVAQRIYAKQGQNQSITTFSVTFPGRACDESEKIEKMAQMAGVDSLLNPFTAFAQTPAWSEQIRSSLELPDSPLITADDASLCRARSRKINVMLDGLGADANLGGSSYPYLQALRGAEFSFLVEYFLHQTTEMGWKRASAKLLRSLAWPLLPEALRARFVANRPLAYKLDLLQPDFLASAQFRERQRNYRNDWRFKDLAHWQHRCAIYDGYNRYELEASERAYAKYGVEQRHPFCDRRMVEFGWAVPDFRHLRNKRRKSLILEGSKKLIPLELQTYENNGHFSNCFQEMLKLPVVSKAFRSLKLSDAGLVSGRRVMRNYLEVMDKSGGGMEIHCSDYGSLLPLFSVLAMELWVREVRPDLPIFQP